MKKNRLFFMFAALLIAAAVMSSCQKEELTAEDLSLKIASGDYFDFSTLAPCPEEEITITFDNGYNNDCGNTQIQMSYNGGDWIQVALKSPVNGEVSYTFNVSENIGDTYEFRGSWTATGGKSCSDTGENIKFENGTALDEIVVTECCVPGFNYVDNGDGTYTFTLTPEEDMEDAELAFTFAQSAYLSGLPDSEGWKQAGNEGQVMKTTIDLTECETLTWTVTLTANCSGNSPNSNVWTDFKINDTSMKADPDDKFTQSCPNE
jgi:hypothetical protein